MGKVACLAASVLPWYIDVVSGASLALLSALLFGVSPPLAKSVMGEMSPILLAGLFYLGSGLGLWLSSSARRIGSFREISSLRRRDRLKLAGATITGGILAPICLAFGIKLATAFEVSLLLNLETVFTTIIAALVFRESVGKRVWAGKVLILAGAAAISFGGGPRSVSPAALLLVAACLFWGMDNNLTRDVEELTPTVLGAVKGLVAGVFNLALAFTLGAGVVTPLQIAVSLCIGAVSYGLSLLLFIKALRLIGAARTSTYFATGPFIGMVFSVVFLKEKPPLLHWACGIVMGVGVWLLYRERHEHLHSHARVTHRHEHVHDEHHQHVHHGIEGPEPHDHVHTHEALTHSHPHLPDIHHRHEH